MVRDVRGQPAQERYLGLYEPDAHGHLVCAHRSPAPAAMEREQLLARVRLRVVEFQEDTERARHLERFTPSPTQQAPLLDDPEGVSSVLYVLEWGGDGDPPAKPAETGKPGPFAPPVNPGKVTDVRCTGQDCRVSLVCHTTRGRILVRELWTANSLVAATTARDPGSAFPGPAVGTVPLDIGQGEVRLVAVICSHDSDAGRSPDSKYAEAEPATATVDVFITGVPGQGAQTPGVFRLFQTDVPPGGFVAYYLRLFRV